MFSNPIGWVQVQINGGFRKQFAIAGIYGFLVIVIMYLAFRAYSLDGHPSVLQKFSGGALTVVTMVELAILYFLSAAAIKKAINRDFTTNMITSHRNTAITGPVAVWGYLTGPTAHVAMLTGVNLLIGTVLAVLAGPLNTPAAPLILLAIFLCPALMLFTLDILIGFSTRGTMVVTPIVAMFNIFGAFKLIDICPGLALLMFSVDTGQLSRMQSPDAVVERLVAMFFQLSLAFTFFLAAARKFTRDDVAGFNETLSFCLLALASLIAGVGFGVHDNTPMQWGIPFINDRRVQLVTTLVPLAWIAMIPVAHAAWQTTEWLRRRRKDEMFAARSTRAPRGFLETALIAVGVVFGILALCNKWVIQQETAHIIDSDGMPPLVWIVAAFLLALASAGAVYYSVYAKAAKAGAGFLVLILLTWVAPIVVELGYGQLLRFNRGDEWTFSPIFGCSPVGTWILTICKLNGAVAPGIGFQLLVAAFTYWLARRARP